MSIKMHKRSQIVTKARHEFDQFVIDWVKRHDLTYGEMFSIFGHAIASEAKYMIRGERHPDDPDKGGDEA